MPDLYQIKTDKDCPITPASSQGNPVNEWVVS